MTSHVPQAPEPAITHPDDALAISPPMPATSPLAFQARVAGAALPGGLPTDELAQVLAPLRVGDPLGLGLTLASRPEAPPDPDAYDLGRENAEFARSLLTEKDRAAVDAEIASNGFLSIQQVRELVAEHTAKGSVESGGLDPEVMALIDARINYKIFVGGDNIYSREELYAHFPFLELGVQPEAVFARQEIGVFPARAHSLQDELEYVARDVGDESVDFVMLEDLVGMAARKDYSRRRPPLRVVKTKIYIGKTRWDDFLLMHRFCRAATRIGAARLAVGAPAAPVLAFLAGVGRQAPLAIADPAAVEAERLAREAEAARREEELRRREEELRLREAEARRREEETTRRLEADLARIEAMLAAVRDTSQAPRAAAAHGEGPPRADAGVGGPRAGAPAPVAGGVGLGDPCDSVPL